MAGDTVNGVDLDASGFQQRFERTDQLKSFDLLGVAARSGKKQHRGTEVAPPHDLHLLFDMR